MKTFLFQGDSITDTNRVDDNEDNFGLGCGYALLLASDFLKNRKDEFRFINRGNSGDRITDVYARIKEDIINLKPDMMSILIGVNDVSHELTQNCGVTPEKFEKIYSMLIEEVTEAGKGKTEEGLVHDLLNTIFKDMPEEYQVEALEERDIQWNCDCSTDRMERALMSIGYTDLKEIIEEDGQAELQCQFCTKKYNFDKEQLEKLLEAIS